jgi:CheY-like chemotaxis protein
MIAKRALIVDDSRSARVILSRMLEAYGLEVDAAESAEQALEYLRQARPDVIFMDHLMPGMDGFQAVQAIKGNPDTAMIPVMMYTSQEGDLYVSQARALGAVGVLPKTVKQGEVSRVLYQLRLLPERREGRAAPAAANQEIIEPVGHRVQIERPPVAAGEIETAVRQAIAPALKELNSELRRFMLAGFEAFAKRLTAEIKSAVSGTAGVQQDPVEVPAAPEPAPFRGAVLAAVCAVALIPTVVLGVLYVRTLGSTNGLLKSNAHLTSVVEDQQTQLRAMQDALRNAANRAAANGAGVEALQNIAAETVPYGEAPLSGARLERLRSLIDDLIEAGFRGKVRVAAYVGEFCLTGNGIEGYSMAADDLPVKRCDVVGNPFDDNLPNAQRQSLQFANLLAGVRQRMADALTIEVDYAGRRPKVPYPDGEQLTKTTAGEWNRVAAQNNRVEFVMEAALADSSG